MTELKHRKRACVMAYLILANEEARVSVLTALLRIGHQRLDLGFLQYGE